MKQNNNTASILKGIAIIMIIMVHSVQTFTYINENVRTFARFGQMGCQIFFLISGFTLCLSWYGKKNSLLDFYKKRLFKIAPGYYIAIFLWVVTYYILYVRLSINNPMIVTDVSVKGIIINLLFLNAFSIYHNNTVLRGGWYIGTIMIFYLVFPLLVKIFKRFENKKIMKFFPMIWTILSVCFQILLYKFKPIPEFYGNNSFIYFSFINQMPCFLLGILLFFEYKKDKFNSYNNLNIIIKLMIYGSISIWLFYSSVTYAFSIISYFVALTFYYLFIIIDKTCNNFKAGLLSNIIIKFNNVSYAAFLIHTLIVWCVPIILFKILNHFNINFNYTILYFIIILPMYFVIYFISNYFTKSLNYLNNRFLKRRKKYGKN